MSYRDIVRRAGASMLAGLAVATLTSAIGTQLQDAHERVNRMSEWLSGASSVCRPNERGGEDCFVLETRPASATPNDKTTIVKVRETVVAQTDWLEPTAYAVAIVSGIMLIVSQIAGLFRRGA